MSKDITIALVGRPNCGKTTLFNTLTGDDRWVGNWPGVTMEGVHGAFQHKGRRVVVVDLPGTYTLTGTRALDEETTAGFLSDGEFDLVLNINDACHPERGLYLSAQVIESQGHLRDDSEESKGRPVLMAFNRVDQMENHELTLNTEAMAKSLGCPVLTISALKGDGIETLKDTILTLADTSSPPAFPAYGESVISEISKIAETKTAKARWNAIRKMEADADESNYTQTAALGEARHSFAATATQVGIIRQKSSKVVGGFGDFLDRIFLNPIAGIPIFLLAMYVMFLWTIHVGGAFIDAFDGVVGAIVTVGLAGLLGDWGFPAWASLVVEGVGGGLQTMGAFVPLVFFLYIFLSFLEESGYMSRAVVLMDRFMRRIGMPGNVFIPLIVGLGCSIPGVMATRTLENKDDRLAAIAMTPFMSCSARLPVYVLFVVTFYPSGGQNIVFLLYFIGFFAAVFTAYVLKKNLFKTKATPLMLELPSYQFPKIGSVIRRAGDRTLRFTVDAGKVVVPVVMVLTILNTVTLDGEISTERPDQSLLSEVGRSLTPILAPIGVGPDNWPAAVGLFTGILAKEAVVGTLASLYSFAGGGAAEEEAGGEEPTILDMIIESLLTVPDALSGVFGAFFDPLGLEGAYDDNQEVVGDESVVRGLNSHFTPLSSFSYLIFILLYAPCVAAIAAVRREAGGLWTIFVVAWTTILAYCLATLTFQIGNFAADPMTSTIWIVISIALIVGSIFFLRLPGLRNRIKLREQGVINEEGKKSGCGSC